MEPCRRIETARCRAAQACGAIADAGSCERFYRDQCLHGFPGSAPSAVAVESCVEALDGVAECARSGDSCNPRCDAVQAPALLPACAFLSDAVAEEEDDPSTGGAGGARGSNDDQPAGAGGAGGADGS